MLAQSTMTTSPINPSTSTKLPPWLLPPDTLVQSGQKTEAAAQATIALAGTCRSPVPGSAHVSTPAPVTQTFILMYKQVTTDPLQQCVRSKVKLHSHQQCCLCIQVSHGLYSCGGGLNSSTWLLHVLSNVTVQTSHISAMHMLNLTVLCQQRSLLHLQSPRKAHRFHTYCRPMNSIKYYH